MNEPGLLFLLLKYVPPAAFLLLIGLWLFAVIRLNGTPRKALLLTGCGVFLLAGLLFGGEWVLQRQELAWRQWVKKVFALLLWCAGFAVSILTVYWIPRAVSGGKRGLRPILRTVAALSLVTAMGFGTLMGAFWLGPESEEIVTYRGTRAVQTESNWLDNHTVIYEYRNSFVRGDDPIGPIGG